jgi:hypothetical protein
LSKEKFHHLLETASGKNEPAVPALISKSFVFVSTTGLREAPEILLLELFRETCFEKFSQLTKSAQLDPEATGMYSKEEKAILYLTRGRAKRSKVNNFSGYFAPAYPSLARGAWLRKASDRQLRDSIFKGFIAQMLRDDSDKKIEVIAKIVIDALFGHRSSGLKGRANAEILSAAISDSYVDANECGLLTSEQAVAHIADLLFKAAHGEGSQSWTFKSLSTDLYAQILAEDFLTICNLESTVPRLQWLDILKCYLRLSVCSWVLSKLRITVWLRDEILRILENEAYMPAPDALDEFLRNRNLNLFKPSSSATDGPKVHVEVYIKARIELTVLILALGAVGGISKLDELELVTTNDGAGKISVSNFLLAFKGHRKQIADLSYPLVNRQWLLRTCERFSAWTSPTENGQGKNLSEFLRVLSRSSESDGDSGYLVTPIRKGGKALSYSIFPGPMLVKTVTFLSAQRKRRLERIAGKGSDRLVLSDVESHFRQYGIEFGMSAGARPRLISELQGLGLLFGSPDAGDSVSVRSPF